MTASIWSPTSPVPGFTADLINFLQAGTGAVPRTVQSKLRDVVSVADFGAVGDGVTDDTAAIQACLNYANSAVNFSAGLNPALYFPGIKYLCGDLFASPSTSGVENNAPAGLYGNFSRGTQLVAKSGTTTMLHCKNTTLRSIRDMWFNCNGNAVSAIDTDWDVGNGPAMNNYYSNVRITGATGTSWKGRNNNDCMFQGIQIASTPGLIALDIDGNGGSVILDQCRFIGGMIKLGAQNFEAWGCVTTGFDIAYGSINKIKISGGYHYSNPTLGGIIKVETGILCDDMNLDGYWETLGTGQSFIVNNGTIRGTIRLNGTHQYTSGGAGSPKILSGTGSNGTGLLRTQLLVNINSNTTIDWTNDYTKYWLVNHLSKVQGFNVLNLTGFAFSNGWSAFGGAPPDIYLKPLEGSRLEIGGDIKGGTVTNGTAILTLPNGIIPTKAINLVVGNTTAPVMVTISTAGVMTLNSASVSASYISFGNEISLEL